MSDFTLPSRLAMRNLITAANPPALDSLPIKIFLSRVRLALRIDSSPASIDKYVAELRELLLKNASLPSVQRDVSKF